MSNYVYLVPLFPLIGFLINGLFRRSLSKSLSGGIGCGTILASFIVSIIILFQLKQEGFQPVTVTLFVFIHTIKLSIPFSFLVDPLSVLFLLIITGVGFLIHVYSRPTCTKRTALIMPNIFPTSTSLFFSCCS